jgi:Holliday junction resolvasome RuvABC endonuclease subunit
VTTLALDLGKKVGWLKGASVGPVQHGTIDLKDTTDLGIFLIDAMTKLPPIIRGVTDIAVEQPFLGDSYYPARKLLGLLGVVYACASVEGISGKYVHEYPVATAKLALAGHGRAEKEAMIAAACDWYGWEPYEIDEHQADAGAILKVHLFGEAPAKRKRPRSGPGTSILRGPGPVR